jgi:hypothetical protein
MPVSYRLDYELGWVPAIPEPFWYRGWRTLFRYRPSCYQCMRYGFFGDEQPTVFPTRKEWEAHYALNHLEEDLK